MQSLLVIHISNHSNQVER